MGLDMTSENYVAEAMRTDTPITPELLARLQDPGTVRLLHGAMGLCTEAGELMDMLKKHVFYGLPLDLVNAGEEAGDNYWYLALIIDELRTSMRDVLTRNIEKLRLRYPEQFTEAAALNRDVTAERAVLERGQSSMRAQDWGEFSACVRQHIEVYTVPQYGDKGADQATGYSAADHIKQVQKYLNRHGKNSRPGQDALDFLKAAHYLQMAAFAYYEEKRYVEDVFEQVVDG